MRTISISLSSRSVKRAMRELQAYQKELVAKCEIFVQRLAEHGIVVAQNNVGGFGSYISFTIETNKEQYGAKAILAATNTGVIHSEWIQADGSVSEADVSPVLMVEFGSGLLANNPRADELGYGTGTFPGQTHAEDPSGWWYMDTDGEWHHSFGIAPDMPMYKAASWMISIIDTVAKEVFGS